MPIIKKVKLPKTKPPFIYIPCKDTPLQTMKINRGKWTGCSYGTKNKKMIIN